MLLLAFLSFSAFFISFILFIAYFCLVLFTHLYFCSIFYLLFLPVCTSFPCLCVFTVYPLSLRGTAELDYSSVSPEYSGQSSADLSPRTLPTRTSQQALSPRSQDLQLSRYVRACRDLRLVRF